LSRIIFRMAFCVMAGLSRHDGIDLHGAAEGSSAAGILAASREGLERVGDGPC
jgi:hypothetical protein